MPKNILCTLLLLVIMTGCQQANLLRPYRLDIQQGNHLDDDALTKLTPGMSQRQVQDLLGNPLLHDPFHPERWDYVYYFRPGHGPLEQRNISLVFSEEGLTEIHDSQQS